MKLFKRLLAVVLAAVMFVGVADFRGSNIINAEAATSNGSELKEGAKSYGFTLKQKIEYENSEEFILVWEHDKTGAQVFFVINDDPERAFGIMFKTEPSDDNGKLHILEHAVCSASEKYPGRDVFFDLTNMGFISNMNASTSHSSTSYYVASLDEKQLMNAADYYLDCAFHSAIRNDPNYFYREGWRYVMADKDAPLDVTGVVYNEMQGALGSIDGYLFRYFPKYLYPDSNYAYISGGVPENILDLTYEELIAFYDQCYHPSNCTAVIYGDVSYKKWLKKLAREYFDAYEREEFTAPEKYVPKGNYGKVTVDYPVYEGTEDLGSRLLYIWDLPDELSYVEFSVLDKLTDYMNLLTSPVMEALNASGIGSTYETFINFLGDQRQLAVYATDADPSRADEFKKIVDKQFKALIKKGVNKDTIDALFETESLTEALATNTEDIGIAVISAVTNAVEAQDMGMITASDTRDQVKKLFDDDKALTLFKKSVVDNNNNLLLVVTPKPGLAEANEKALADKLAAKKAAMSDAEIQAVVDATAAFDEWNENTETDEAVLAKLVTAKASKIEITKPEFNTTVSEENGVKVYTAEVNNDASYYRFFFDISNLSAEQTQVLNEYIQYIGLSTTNRSQDEVDNDCNRFLSDLDVRISLNEMDGKSIPTLLVGFYAFPENLDKALDLVFDMLLNTDVVSNAEFIGQYSYYFYMYLTDPETLLETAAVELAGSYSDYSRRLSWLLNGIPRFELLENALGSEEAFGELIAQMTEVREEVVKRQNGVVYVIGRPDSFESSKKKMLDRFPAELTDYETGSICTLEKTPKTTGIIMNTQASYLLSYYQPKKTTIKSTAARMLACALLEDQLYIPQFRYVMGAYGGFCGTGNDGYVYSELYRASSFAEPYEIIQQAPEYLDLILEQITNKDLNGYKLSLISRLITPYGDFKMAINELFYEKNGQGSDIAYDLAKEVANLSVKDLKKQVKKLRKIFKKSGTAIIGTEEEIQANAEMFDKVYDMR